VLFLFPLVHFRNTIEVKRDNRNSELLIDERRSRDRVAADMDQLAVVGAINRVWVDVNHDLAAFGKRSCSLDRAAFVPEQHANRNQDEDNTDNHAGKRTGQP
jgi:hypothetical protein